MPIVIISDVTQWTHAYRQFIDITLKHFPDEQRITEEVTTLYNQHKGDKHWDEAWQRWNSLVETGEYK